MNRAAEVTPALDTLAALRVALAQERPILLKVIEEFGEEMYRQGAREAARAARVAARREHEPE
jgi:hypothetical protein